MAFLGVLLSFALIAVLFGFVLFISIAPIIIGTIVIKKHSAKSSALPCGFTAISHLSPFGLFQFMPLSVY